MAHGLIVSANKVYRPGKKKGKQTNKQANKQSVVDWIRGNAFDCCLGEDNLIKADRVRPRFVTVFGLFCLPEDLNTWDERVVSASGEIKNHLGSKINT